MLKRINREKLPLKTRVYDSNWNRGIMIGNTVIFMDLYESKKIKSVYQKDNYTHGFYVEYKNDPVLKILYIR